LILYNSKKEMIAVSPEIIDFLGFDSIDEMNEKIQDIADLFVNKPGFIYNFKNFSWIDYIIFNHLKSPKVILKTLTSEIETEILITELIDINEKSKYYHVSFKNLNLLENDTNFEEESFKGFEEKGFENSFAKEETFQEMLKPIEDIVIEDEIKPSIDEPLTIDFDQISVEETPKIAIEEPIIKESKSEDKIYDFDEVANELGLDKSLIQDLLVEFIAQAYELQPQIQKALENEDYILAHNLIHKIKGAAANLRVKKANEILADTTGIDDKNILKELLNSFYNFIEKLNSELMLSVQKPAFSQNEKTEIIKEEEKEEKLYDPKIASNELGIPEDVVLEFVSEYIKQSNDFKNEIEQYIQNSDIENIKNLIHKLKGTATNLRLEKANIILNNALKSNDITKIKNLIENFYILLDKIAKEFNFKIDIDESQLKKEYKQIIKNSAKEIGLEEDLYNELIKDFTNEVLKILSYDDYQNIKKELQKYKSLVQNIKLQNINHLFETIIDTDNIENINKTKKELEEKIMLLKEAI